MPFSGGYNLSRMGTYYAQRAQDRQPVEPIPAGVNPLDVLDPETRALVTTIDEPSTAEPEVEFSDRVGGALVGAGLGAVIGVLLVNGGGYRYRRYRSGPMDTGMTAAMAGIGATIGAVAGFARGGDPIGGPKAPVIPASRLGTRSSTPISLPAAFTPPSNG
jgi:hypothetical protein